MPLSAGKTALANALLASWAQIFTNTAPSVASDFANANLAFAETGVPTVAVTGTLAAGQVVAVFVTTTPGAVAGAGVGGIDTPTPGIGLAAAKSILVTSLTAVFANNLNTVVQAADGVADAIYTYLSQAKILTSSTGTCAPGALVPALVGPVGSSAWSGAGTGGIESSSPGPGLAVALAGLVTDMTLGWADLLNTPLQIAQDIADALETFFESALVTTVDSGTAGGGPATVDAITGSGVTIAPGSPATGTGSGVIA